MFFNVVGILEYARYFFYAAENNAKTFLTDYVNPTPVFAGV